MRKATGRPIDDVGAATVALLSLLDNPDPSPEQMAGCGILANGLLDLAIIRRALTSKG